MRIVQPVFKALPDSVLTAGFVSVGAILALVLVALSAGLFARTRTGKRMLRWFEDSMLSGIPQYQFAKSMAEGLTKMGDNEGVKPALISIEDGWQLGYLLMELESDWVAVFLPQAPTPMSGNIMYFPGSRVKKLDITMVQAMSIIKRMGAGSREALEGVSLATSAR